MKMIICFFILGLSINTFAHGYLVIEIRPWPHKENKVWLLYKSGSQWRIVHNKDEYCNVYNVSENKQNKTLTFTLLPISTRLVTWPYTQIVPMPECMCSICLPSGLQEQEVEFDGIVQ